MNHLQVHTVVERVLPEVDNVLGNSKAFRTKVNRNWITVHFKKIGNSPSKLQRTRSTLLLLLLLLLIYWQETMWYVKIQ